MEPTTDITLRDARPDEYDAVRALLLAAYDEYRPAAPPGLWAGYARDIIDLEGRAAESVLIVAERAGVVVGAVTFYPDASRGGQGWPAGYAGFRLLAVHPSARSLGLGRTLTAECLRRARALGCSHVGLHTTVFMATAKAMYQRMGFVPAPSHDMQAGPLTIEAFELALR